MDVREHIKFWTPPSLVSAGKFLLRKTPSQKINQYLNSGRIPWSTGYELYKDKVIQETIQEANLIKIFQTGESLPENYGVGLDERCVEYPWLFSRLPQTAQYVLDAGSVLNYDYLLEQPYFSGKKLHILTLAPERNCYWFKGVSYLYEDLRSLPFKDSFYDVVVCLSTLEHIGLDNTQYTQSDRYREALSGSYKLAVKEISRILKPGGSLFLSVPFGAYQNFGDFQQFDSKLLAEAISAFGSTQSIEISFFKYTSSGWKVASEESCANCKYALTTEAKGPEYEGKPTTNGQNTSDDRAAAARAVACVHIIR